ncbi:MAG: triphosphoribosyl-dephospho-CoA synthase CitG [Clostridia bacterium]|nr:triphosphoribosyl-dephospho-CoA synthase CitG [Clostridia bacterium]
MEVTVPDMMEARERRASRQRELLTQYGETLLCFTMNIPGPVKDSPLIRSGFALGRQRLRQAFLRLGIRPLHEEEDLSFTGCEAFFVLPLPALQVKRMAADIEEDSLLGRLFDLDVLRPGGVKVERQEIGLPGRRCLLCGNPAQVCARSRAHALSSLQAKTHEILEDAVQQAVCRRIAQLSVRALLYEVNVTPKPGLVDRANAGSHRDMDIFTFAASACALYPYYYRCAQIGFETASLAAPETFAALRAAGRMAEGEMLEATGGVNTHKGAIFSLGLLAAAAGRTKELEAIPADRILSECRAMTAGLTAADFAVLTPDTAQTAGQRLYLQFGLTGVRGEAEQGFPLVALHGLPKLREGIAAGLSPNDAGCAALLSIMAHNTDTNILHRGGMGALERVRQSAASLLEREPFPSAASVAALDEELIRENISPGGSADLLALCFFLYFLEEAV